MELNLPILQILLFVSPQNSQKQFSLQMETEYLKIGKE